jgi:D-alanine-D-alanine ligase
VGLGISLDKGITKLVAREIGIPTPDFRIFYTPGELETCLSEEELSYPLLIKPNNGGSSLGIRQKSKVYSPEELLREGERIFTECGDSVLAEVFIPGREFASAVFNRGDGPEMLPAAEIRLAGGDPESFYHLDMKSRHQKEVICPAELPERIRKEMDESALHLFNRLGLKDLARIDYRLDRNGKLWMLEINPLPGLSPFYSVFPVQAKAAGIAPEEIIHQLIYNNLRGRNGKQRLEMAGKKHNPVHGRTE